MSTDTMTSKIKALLNKAEGTDNEAEREAFEAKAFELIAKYNIDQLTLVRNADEGEVISIDQHVKGAYASARAYLLYSLATACGVRPVLRGTSIIILVGFKEDVEAAVNIFEMVDVQMARALHRAVQQYEGSRIKSYKRAFILEYASGASNKLAEANRAAIKAAEEIEKVNDGTPSSVALAIRSRNERVNDKFTELFPEVRSSSVSRSNSSGGAGYKAGLSADIGSGRIGGTRAALSA